MAEQSVTTIKKKMLGIRMQQVRMGAGLTAVHTAGLLGVSPETLAAYEMGSAEPGLPLLEALARLCNVPVAAFWEAEHLTPTIDYNHQRAISLRRKMLGAKLAQARDEAGLTREELANKLARSSADLAAMEFGQADLPFSDLLAWAEALDLELADLTNGHGSPQPALPPVAPIPALVAAPSPPAAVVPPGATSEAFSHFPDEVNDFLRDPANLLYVRLAMSLESVSVDNLRRLAEGILDITY